MGQALAISWNDTKKGGLRAAALAFLVALASFAAPGLGEAIGRLSSERVSVIVRELPGAAGAPEAVVASLGGEVRRQISLIGGFSADVPAGVLQSLRTAPGIHSVTPDSQVWLQHAVDGYNPAEDAGSMYSTIDALKAREFWKQGITGSGVTVALIDSGVVPVNGLTYPGKVINGPDLSFESQADHLRYQDTFGHGTHMAGIIAGRDDGAAVPTTHNDHHSFMGVAPDAKILNVKVANATGAVDVSQVIAAIDWVVQHRNDNGMNVRVLNLSFGTDGVQDYRLDPLTFATEVAWHYGIVVVASAGNSGFGSSKLNNPAYDPFVIAVGASDTKGTYTVSDDTVPDWSSRGDGTRNPDFVAPGKSIVSLRDPNSYIDQTYSDGRVGSRFFRGSGTSQAAAAVSGAAALLLQQRPNLTPDQVKYILKSTAAPMPVADPVAQGSGVMDLKNAARAATPSAAVATQSFDHGTGLGSLEAARGSGHVVDQGGELVGEMDIFGKPWDAQSWRDAAWAAQSWRGGDWNGSLWSGDAWDGVSWAAQSWRAQSWRDLSWSAQSWRVEGWDAQSWRAQSWRDQAWDAQSWRAQSWRAQSWRTDAWSGSLWGGPASTKGSSPSTSTTSSPTEPAPAESTEPAPEPSPTEAPALEPEPAPEPTLSP